MRAEARQNEQGADGNSGSVRAGEPASSEAQAATPIGARDAQEIARLRGAVAEAIRLMDKEPLPFRAIWMPVRDVLTDALEEE